MIKAGSASDEHTSYSTNTETSINSLRDIIPKTATHWIRSRGAHTYTSHKSDWWLMQASNRTANNGAVEVRGGKKTRLTIAAPLLHAARVAAATQTERGRERMELQRMTRGRSITNQASEGSSSMREPIVCSEQKSCGKAP